MASKKHRKVKKLTETEKAVKAEIAALAGSSCAFDRRASSLIKEHRTLTLRRHMLQYWRWLSGKDACPYSSIAALKWRVPLCMLMDEKHKASE